MAGIHWDGEGARRRRFWPGGLGVVVDATLLVAVVVVEVAVEVEQEALSLSAPAGKETTSCCAAAARLPLLGTPETLLLLS